MNRDGKDTQDGTISNHPEFLCSRKNPSECRRVVGLMGCRLRLNIALILLLFILSIADGASEDGSAECADGGSFGGFAAFVVADDCAEEAAEHRASSRAAFSVVHGAGAADEHGGGEREGEHRWGEFVFHNFSVFKG